MAVQTSIIVDVFAQEAQARRALEALKQAGFGYDQVGIAPQGQGSVNLLQHLLDLGVPPERASYYAQQVKAGRTIVSVRPDGREQEAHDILRSNGAYDAHQRTASPQTTIADEQRAASAQAVVSTWTAMSDQTATNIQDNVHQPHSLKPHEKQLNVTEERVVQIGDGDLSKDVVTEQKPIPAPVMREEVVSEEHLHSGKQIATTPIGEEETIPVSEEQAGVKTLPTHTHTEKNRRVRRFPNGLLLGLSVGLLGIGLLVAFMRGREIPRLVSERLQRLQQKDEEADQ